MIKGLLSTGLLIGLVMSQEPPPGPPPGPDPQGHERMEMMKMWKMTDMLHLSEDQAQKFFPRYSALGRELWELGKQQQAIMKEIGEMVKEGQEVDEKALDKMVKKATQLEKQKLDKKQAFVDGLGDILTPEQKAKYLVFEVRFKQELGKRIREHWGPMSDRPGPRPEKRRKRRRWE